MASKTKRDKLRDPDMLGFLQDAFNYSQNHFVNPLSEVWKARYLDFICTYGAGQTPYTDHKYFLPLANRAITTFERYMYFAFFNEKPSVASKSDLKNVSLEAEVIGQVVNRQIRTPQNRLEVFRLIEDAGIYGLSWAKIYWDDKYHVPRILRCSPFDIYPDPAAVNPFVPDMRYLIHEYYVTHSQIKQAEAKRYYFPGVSDLLKKADDSGQRRERQERAENDLNEPAGWDESGLGNIKIQDYWGLYDFSQLPHDRQGPEEEELPKEGMGVCLITWAPEHELILRARPVTLQPERVPFVCGSSIPHGESLGGMSILKSSTGLLDGANELFNLGMDHETLNRVGAYLLDTDETELTDINHIYLEPGMLLKMSNPESLKPFPHDTVQPDPHHALLAFFQDQHRETTGSQEQLTGAYGPRKEAATTSMILKQGAEGLFALRAELFNITCMQPLAEQMENLVLQFKPQMLDQLASQTPGLRKQIEQNGPIDWSMIEGGQIETLWVASEKELTKEVKVDNLLKLMALVVQNVQLLPFLIEPIEKIADTMGEKGFGRLFNPAALYQLLELMKQTQNPSLGGGGGPAGRAAPQPNATNPAAQARAQRAGREGGGAQPQTAGHLTKTAAGKTGGMIRG